MTKRPSLLERASEVYDFASGLPMVDGQVPEPVAAQPRPHAQKPVPVAVAAPADAPRAIRRPTPTAAAAHARRIEVDVDVMAASGLLVPGASGAGLAEELRLVKRRLLATVDAAVARGDDRARVVLIASGQPGEGKTFMALNLALSIATEQERSVLLIDGDNAKPELLARMGVEEVETGFLDSLADPRLDPESLIVDTDIPRLSVLPAGRKDRNIPEYFASARMPELITRLCEADPSRIILIDSSPALAASATGVLAQHAGQTLVIVKADSTAEADLKETLDLLSGCDDLSLVLNGTAFQVGSRRFGKYEEYR